MRHEDAGQRLRLCCQPARGVLANREGFEVHEACDQPADRGSVLILGERALHAGVDDEESVLRMAQRVEVDLDGLRSILQAVGHGSRMV